MLARLRSSASSAIRFLDDRPMICGWTHGVSWFLCKKASSKTAPATQLPDDRKLRNAVALSTPGSMQVITGEARKSAEDMDHVRWIIYRSYSHTENESIPVDNYSIHFSGWHLQLKDVFPREKKRTEILFLRSRCYWTEIESFKYPSTPFFCCLLCFFSLSD